MADECRHLRTLIIDGPFNEHEAKRICIDCLGFIAWASKPVVKDKKAEYRQRIDMLLSGPLFEPRSYKGQNGEDRTWDDREFFESIKKSLGFNNLSMRQEEILLKRFDYYAKNGHKLAGQARPVPPSQPAPKIVEDGMEIPF